MIKYVEGNIFDSPAQTIVNTVNTVGVMGKGLALSFKERYPEMFVTYRNMCEKHKLLVGKLMLYSAADHMILLFPTKENWRNPSRIEYIDAGLSNFVRSYAQHHITSIAFPKLGCGNGELSWDTVKPVMERYLSSLPIDVYIYLNDKSNGLPEHKAQKNTMKWLKENAKDLSFNAIKEEIILETAITPIKFSYNDSVYLTTYKTELVFNEIEKKQEIIVKEEDFYQTWDLIRKEKIFVETNEESTNLVYALLHKLGYLSSVSIVDNKTSMIRAGYQVREGLGRAFSLYWGEK